VPVRRRIKWTLFTAQSLGSAGFLISSTVAPIVGATLSGHPTWAGVPAVFYWSGGAGFALLWGRLMDWIGRRRTLSLGLAAGMVGAGAAMAALIAGSFPGFVAGLVLMGAANTALQQARFVAAEVHPAAERGRAIATVVLGGTVGGILGPLVVGPSSRWAERLAVPGLAGPYGASLLFFIVAALVVSALLRPEPRDIALSSRNDPGPPVAARPLLRLLADRGVQSVMLSMFVAQGTMSMLMVISSLHMQTHHHSLGSISVMMSSHVIGMFAFSMMSGRLADAWGRGRLIAAGGVLLMTAGLGATRAVALGPMAAVLLVLGLGWNFCFVGGSALLSDRVAPVERARIQGLNDALLTSGSAIGSGFSGLAFAGLGFGSVGVLVMALGLVPLAMGWRVTGPAPTATMARARLEDDSPGIGAA
jgi:MFS family permease